MLSLTRKADYALVALVYLGVRQRQSGGPASARLVAETFDLPLPVLMNTLKSLSRQGLIHSQRGVAGGYELARDPAELTVLEIVRAVEHEAAEHEAAASPDEDTDAAAEGALPGSSSARSGLGSRAVRRLQDRLDGFLDRLTLADLLADGDAEAITLVALRSEGQLQK